jgi:hypothetical protein
LKRSDQVYHETLRTVRSWTTVSTVQWMQLEPIIITNDCYSLWEKKGVSWSRYTSLQVHRKAWGRHLSRSVVVTTSQWSPSIMQVRLVKCSNSIDHYSSSLSLSVGTAISVLVSSLKFFINSSPSCYSQTSNLSHHIKMNRVSNPLITLILVGCWVFQIPDSVNITDLNPSAFGTA